MKHFEPFAWALLALGLLALTPSPALAQEEGEVEESATRAAFAKIFGFSRHLRLEPRAVSTTGGDSTVGLDFEYKRRFADPAERGDVDLYFEASGFLAADEAVSPERQLEGKLRLHVIDLASHKRADDFQTFVDPESDTSYRRLPEQRQIYQDPRLKQVRGLYRKYQIADGDEERRKFFNQASLLWWEITGEELTEDDDGFWPELDAYEGDWMEKESEFRKGVSMPWFSLEVNAGIETDQEFGDLQYVGGARVYGKWATLGVPVDFLLEAIRGYAVPRDYLNYQGGPYLWAGFDFVDASENEARKAVTGNSDETFGRFSAGAYYRNELFSFGEGEEAEPVALELTWEFYAELDAPSAIRAADSDQTSFFKAAVIFEDGLFLEYKDGRKPLDLINTSAVALGWRFGF